MPLPVNGHHHPEPASKGGEVMGIGVSIFLIALGAILAFAVEVTFSGLDLQTVGVILMIVGAIGLVASLLFWSSFSPYGRRGVGGDRVVVRDREIL